MVTQRLPAMIWLAMYASLTEREGRRIFWYAVLRQFVPGTEIRTSCSPT